MMGPRTAVFISVLLAIGQGKGETVKTKAEEALRKTLMSKYDENTRPSDKTVINFMGLEILDLIVHESDHALSVHSWLKYTWFDPRLKWNPSDHANIDVLMMDIDSLWHPDLSVYNSAASHSTVPDASTMAVLYSTGKLLHVPPYHLEFTCIMDMTYWPHDTHNCSVRIGSWVHSGLILDLVLDNFKTEIKTAASETESGNNISIVDWNIVADSVVRRESYYACCVEPYVNIDVTILLERNAPAYAWTVKLPAACLSLLTLILFLLPPGAGEKIVFGGLCLILDFLYINYTSNAISHAPSHTPLIVQLIGQQIVLVLVSVFVSAMVLRTARGPHAFGLPSILKKPALGLAKILCLGNYVDIITGPHNTYTESIKAEEAEAGNDCTVEIHRKEYVSSSEWVLLAAVVDRMAFLLYLAISIITLIRFHSVL